MDHSRPARHLRSVPPSAVIAPRVGPGADLVAAVSAVCERLCARATVRGEVTVPAPPGEVALELRDLLPTVDDAAFDRHLAAVVRAAGHVSAAEAADACDVAAYAEAAWQAGLDPADAGHPLAGATEEDPDGCTAFRSAVIDHWDLALHSAVLRLVAEERGTATPDAGGGAATRIAWA